MTGITKQQKRIATWLSRERLGNELYSLSDRSLQDMGLVRYQPTLEARKLLWMV
jgi:uncharacterized protein YjiS (DUF1127 family)